MKNCIGKIKDVTYYCICEKYPVTEYVVGAVDSLDDTTAIMDMCPWTFSLLEVAKLFVSRYVRTAISIVLTGTLWLHCGKQIVTELSSVVSMPSWLLPICLLGASDIFTRILGEVLNILYEGKSL